VDLRTLTDHLTAHQLFGRGDNRRDYHLCDFGLIKGNYKSAKSYTGILFVEQSGKVNKVASDLLNLHVYSKNTMSERLHFTVWSH